MWYIDYKILLTNTDFICPSEEDLKLRPKASYQFVITTDNEQIEMSASELSDKSKAYRFC